MTNQVATETRFYILADAIGFRRARTCVARAVSYGCGARYVSKANSDDGRAHYVANMTPEQAANAVAVAGDFAMTRGVTAAEVVEVVTASAAAELPAGWVWDNEQRTCASNEATGRTVAGFSTELAIAAAIARS